MNRSAPHRLVVILPSLVALTWHPAGAADVAPLGNPVGARQGMVVTAQHLASEVGADVLRQGGNAVDAAVAVGYALAVVYPAAGNLGGGGFMTLRMADGRTDFLDFREKAPLAAKATMFLDAQGNAIQGASSRGWRAVGVPGTPAGLEAARTRYGTRSRTALMAPAVGYARDGFRMEPGDDALLELASPELAADPATRAIYAPRGAAPVAGTLFRQPALARSLAAIAAQGPAAVYDGPIGAAMVAASQAGGGILAREDFTRYEVRWLPPVTCDYRGLHIISAPPPSSGGVTLCEMLAILQGYDLHAAGWHSAAEVHWLAEAMRHAFFDRNAKLGDPAFVHNPVAALIDPGYAARIRGGIAPEQATPSSTLVTAQAGHEGSNTTAYSIVDAAGNAVAVTYTLNDWFGIGRVAGDTGILMNDEMDDFAAKPGSPNMFGLVQGDANAVAPGKTPLSSMTPTIVTRDGRTVLVVGSPGGPRIITTVLQVIVDLVDHGMNVQQAVDAPRVHEQGLPDTLYVEPFALSPDTAALLVAHGYSLTPSGPHGMAEAILVGAPSLSVPAHDTKEQLAMPPPWVPDATLFGAHDVRGAQGRASGVD